MITDYQKYIHRSRYARYLQEEGRRETWDETVDRYISFMVSRFQEAEGVIEALGEASNAIKNMEVMPSMRALMTAGKAADRDHCALYNCSYLPVDTPRAFDEAMYILMCGTGVGFSVERQYVSKLPEVSEEFHDTDSVIVVGDSKIGWASAFRELVSLLYAGKVPKWDLSRLRPAGAPLKTFGGRSSGPEPLDSLFRFTVETFRRAAGRKLNSLECHDIMCKIGEIVVVGGVRRSAMISLSNLTDDRMRNAKMGQWWVENPQRALANNSVCYTEKPDMGAFMKEWKALYDSKSGERGIFNRVSAQKIAAKNGRRDPDHDWGTNPCQPSFATVLTPDGITFFSNIGVGSVIWSGKRWTKVINKVFTGIKPVYAFATRDGVFIGTREHRVFERGKRIKAENAKSIDTCPMPPGFRQQKVTQATAVHDITYVGDFPVYDITVEAEEHSYWSGGLLVSNCSEIILRPNQMCNLTEVVVRPDDSFEDLKRKVRIAAFLGTLQASFTDFRYLRKIWSRTVSEEALLGVSLTGIMDHPHLSGKKTFIKQGKINQNLANTLHYMRDIAIGTNKEWAEKIGINQATAVTCCKPSGTVSQLVDSASGIHPRFSKFYIRRVRSDNKDPITQFMKDQGVPNEPDVMKPDSTTVFSFPMKAPETSVVVSERSAIEQLEHWKLYQDYWCEHKPSVTIYVKEDEWMEVGSWVWKNFDYMSGVSFLPYTEHSYQQAPYEEIDEEMYDKLTEDMPELSWEELSKYEDSDMTTGSQEFACVSGACEI